MMFRKTPYIKGKNEASPDRINIPEWGYRTFFRRDDTIVFSLYKDRLYICKSPMTHAMMYKAVNPYMEGFDGRVWTGERIISFWCDGGTSKEDVLRCMRSVREKFDSFDYETVGEFDSVPDVDLSGYRVLFLCLESGESYLAECDWGSFFTEEFDVACTDGIRFRDVGLNSLNWKDKIKATDSV